MTKRKKNKDLISVTLMHLLKSPTLFFNMETEKCCVQTCLLKISMSSKDWV